MSVKFLFDENISDALWQAVQGFNQHALFLIEALRVGDSPDLPKGADDATVLLWAERNGCILVSLDKRTLPNHLSRHLAAGHHVPGLFLIGHVTSTGQIIELLAVAAQSEDPLEWQDMIEYLT
jgi:hypothetical protein